MRRGPFLWVALGLIAWACSGSKQLPPGLAAPEYERPALEPWPPPDAGAAEAAKEPVPAPVTDASPAPPPDGAAGATSP